MKKNQNKFIQTSKIVVSAFVLLFGFSFVANAAWSNPGSAPTGGNTDAPINVGGNSQSKAGGLSIGGNLSIGSLIQLNSVEGSVNADEFTGAEFLYNSDRRLKKDIKPLTGNLVNNLLNLQGVTYKWKENNQQDIGFVAQEVEEFYPEIVKTGSDGYKSVKYANLIAPLVEITKQQQDRIESLEARISELEKEL